MVRNKEELIQVSNAWLDVARNDVRKHAINFMHMTNIDAPTLADILDTDVETIESMLNGTCDIPMSLFAKILIATNNAIVITPVEDPRMRQPQTAPMGQRRQMGGCAQPRNERGQFVPRNPRREQPNAQCPRQPMGYPMPNPNGQFPPFGMMPSFSQACPQGGWGESEEDAMARAAHDAMEAIANDNALANEMPVAPANEAHGNTRVDEIASRLANAFRQNPEAAELMRSLLDVVEG